LPLASLVLAGLRCHRKAAGVGDAIAIVVPRAVPPHPAVHPAARNTATARRDLHAAQIGRAGAVTFGAASMVGATVAVRAVCVVATRIVAIVTGISAATRKAGRCDDEKRTDLGEGEKGTTYRVFHARRSVTGPSQLREKSIRGEIARDRRFVGTLRRELLDQCRLLACSAA